MDEGDAAKAPDRSRLRARGAGRSLESQLYGLLAPGEEENPIRLHQDPGRSFDPWWVLEGLGGGEDDHLVHQPIGSFKPVGQVEGEEEMVRVEGAESDLRAQGSWATLLRWVRFVKGLSEDRRADRQGGEGA
jgi:hypothetical protein